MITINTRAEFNSALLQPRTVVMFTAPWCHGCHALKKRIVDLPVVEVDTDRFVELATRYDVRSLPTVVIFENGEPIDSRSGQFLNAAYVKGLFA
jgi:thioredoxin-like negative regulator of GroEL